MPRIAPKPKKCKGTGRANGHGCGKPSLWRKYGLCRECYPTWLLNTPEGAKVVAKSTITAKKRVEHDKKRKERKWKEDNKSIQKLIGEAKTVFQAYIRMRDANESCISCQSTTAEIWDGGHYKKAEIFSGVIFDERNVHKQCRKCNSFLGGNEAEYRKGLVRKYGENFVQQLEEDATDTRVKKYTREELREIKAHYAAKIRNHKKQ